jgi:hypothetical protein
MTSQYERLQEGFATIYLTLSSVVIALALEKLFDRMVSVAPLPPTDLPGTLIWLQGAVILLVAFCIFVISAYFALALRWEIGVFDAAAPFFLLILLAGAITAIGQGRGTAFFYIAALGQSSGFGVITQVLREARRNPANHEILHRSDFTGTYVAGAATVVIPAATGALLHLGAVGAMGAVVGASFLLLGMLAIVSTFTRSVWHSIRRGASGAGPSDGPAAAARSTSRGPD